MEIGNYVVERGDSYNIVIKKKGVNKKTGEPTLQNFKYYGTWENALLALFNHSITSSEAKKVLTEIQQAKKEIISAINKQGLK